MPISKMNSSFKQIKFVKGQCIYKGDYGEIFSGLSLDTGEIIAIKTLNLGNLNESQKKEKYKSLEKMFSLKHKNLINIMTLQETDNTYRNLFNLNLEIDLIS